MPQDRLSSGGDRGDAAIDVEVELAERQVVGLQVLAPQSVGQAEFISERLPELISAYPGLKSPLTAALRMDLDDFIMLANEQRLKEEIAEKIQVRGTASDSPIKLPKTITDIPKF